MIKLMSSRSSIYQYIVMHAIHMVLVTIQADGFINAFYAWQETETSYSIDPQSDLYLYTCHKYPKVSFPEALILNAGLIQELPNMKKFNPFQHAATFCLDVFKVVSY